jgi:hypothetical protein
VVDDAGVAQCGKGCKVLLQVIGKIRVERFAFVRRLRQICTEAQNFVTFASEICTPRTHGGASPPPAPTPCSTTDFNTQEQQNPLPRRRNPAQPSSNLVSLQEVSSTSASEPVTPAPPSSAPFSSHDLQRAPSPGSRLAADGEGGAGRRGA